jgi:hypothetical protein
MIMLDKLSALWNALTTFAETHPHVFDALCLYVGIPLVAVILKKLSARFSTIAEMLTACGLDAPKLVALFRKKVKPSAPPLPLIFMVISLACVALLSCFALGCASTSTSSPTRDIARATVLAVTDGVQAADHACAELVNGGDREAGTKCLAAYKVAQPALVAAAIAVDAWDDGRAGEVGCAVFRVVEALRSMSKTIAAAGSKLPSPLVDAIAFASGAGALACPRGAT